MRPATFAILALTFTGHLVNGADLDVLTAGTSSFSQGLYRELAVSQDNAVYSPFSIHACLSMCYAGARGETATEMSSTLGLTSLTNPHQTYHDLITQMNSVQDVKLETANAIYVNPNMAIESSFLNEVETNYYASVSNFDLGAPGGPEAPINDFIETKTKNMIQNMLPPGSIDGSTVMILVNTIFFNGTWQTKFADYKTNQQEFSQLAGAKTQVDMMHDERSVKIKRNVHGADVAELPFQDPRFSLYIVLPQKVDGITELETQLATPGSVDDFFTGLQPSYVQLAIPKFKIESTFPLNGALQNLGMVKPFDSSAADFSGLASQGNVFISSVLHKAMIEVKETGTVAAAATTITFTITSVHLPPTDTFIADHPFIFFLRDNTAGNILFQGKFSG